MSENESLKEGTKEREVDMAIAAEHLLSTQELEKIMLDVVVGGHTKGSVEPGVISNKEVCNEKEKDTAQNSLSTPGAGAAETGDEIDKSEPCSGIRRLKMMVGELSCAVRKRNCEINGLLLNEVLNLLHAKLGGPGKWNEKGPTLPTCCSLTTIGLTVEPHYTHATNLLVGTKALRTVV